MKKLVLLVAVAAAGCPPGSRTGGGWSGWGTPSGAYRQSCGGIRVDGNYLKASCRTNAGSWRNTSLDLRACNSNIVNNDGHLRCGGGGGWGGGGYGRLPKGSYRTTCSNIRVQDGRLIASCRTGTGKWRQATAGVNTCRRFGNDDGRLVCE